MKSLENAVADRPAIRVSLLVTLALLASVAPIATDLYLSAFPGMATDLQSSATGIQFTLTAFLLGAALGQLLFGPLSDRLGRMRPLVVGAVVYVIASVAAALAPTLAVLIACRFVQGVSGAAGMVIGRAIVSDLAKGREAARAFSLLMLVGGVAPVIAPLAGSLLLAPLGWRGLLWIIAGVAVVGLVATLLVVRETHPAEARAKDAGSAGQGRALMSRRFLGNAVAYAIGFAVMMAYISASPFLYQVLMGMSEVQYGMMFAANAVVLCVVSAAAAKITRTTSAVPVARIGLGINLAAVAVIGVLVLMGTPTVAVCLAIMVAVGSLGLVFGTTTALALDSLPGGVGMGSAVLGVAQFGLAGAVSPLVSIGGETTAVPLAVVMIAASLIANIALWAAGGMKQDEIAAPEAEPVAVGASR